MTRSVSSPPQSIRLHKLVQAPIQRVYDAWLDPTQLTEWWRPDPNGGVSEVQIDARVGGTYRINMGSREKPFIATGQYTVLDRPHRLAFTWSYEQMPGVAQDSLVTIELYEVDNPHHAETPESSPKATEIVFTHERLTTPAARSDHNGGWWNLLVSLGYFVRGVNPRDAMQKKAGG